MIRYFYIFLFSISFLLAVPKVTYEKANSRLGDLLVTYLHAKWISYQYGLPLAFRPFDYSDLFSLHQLETPLKPDEKVVALKHLYELNDLEDKVYEILYTPESRGEFTQDANYWLGRPAIQVDWNDQGFIEWVRPFFIPTVALKTLPLPTDKVTVALHIRRPYGVDNDPHIDQVFPYKFLPDQFYISQLRYIYEEMGRRPLYVYIFSNDPKARQVAVTFQKALKNRHITFDYPKFLDESHLGVLSDFYSMMNFDCMIRPDSNLSIIASKLGYQKIVISPEHITVNRRGNVVDRIKIDRR